MAFARWIKKHIPSERVALRVSTGWGLRKPSIPGWASRSSRARSARSCLGGGACGWWMTLRHRPWVLTHRDLRTATRVRALRDFVVSALRAKRALIEGTTPATRRKRGK